MKRILIIVGAVVAVLVVAGGIAAFLFLRELSLPGEATARFVPASAPVYISVNLRPGIGQLRLARDVLNQLQTDDFIDKRDELLDDLEDETGIHFLDDVSSWIGVDLSLAVLSIDRDQTEWVLLAQVSDLNSAEDFVEDLVDYFEDEFFTEFDSDSGREVDLWVADDEDIAIGLTEDYLLIADGEDTIEDMVENIESPPTRSLADSEAFVQAQQSLPGARVLFMFLQADEALEALEEELDPYGDNELFREALRNAPEYMAASASFVDDGIRFDVIGDPIGDFIFDTDSRIESPEVLPSDTVVLLSMVGLDEAWQEGMDALEEADPYVWEDFEELLDEFKEETDVDLEGDVIDSLSGELALALLPSDLDFLAGDFDEFGLVEALLLFGVDDPEEILDALDSIVDLLEDEGIDVDRSSLGGDELVTAKMDDDSLERYEPGYVVTDEWAVVGSNVDGLEAFHDALSGEADSLRSNPEFGRLIGFAPEPLHLLLYADVANMLEMVEDALDADARADYRNDVEPYVEQLGALLVSGSMTEEKMRFSMVLTLRDE